MKTLLFLSLFLGLSVAHSQSGEVRTPVPAVSDNVHFSFGSQDGEISYSCTHEWQVNLEDFLVTCVRPENLTAMPMTFIAHLRIFRHEREVAPKTAYEILFWVTDRQAPAGGQGKYVGSTTWVRLNESSTLSSLSVSQDVQDTNELRVEVLLK